MKKYKRVIGVVLICTMVCVFLISGCGKKDKEEVTTDAATSSAEKVVEEKDYLKMQTSIAYSSGDTKNWTYGNQRKEFPNNETCYVRIGTTAITTDLFGKGKGDSVTITYRFTGTEKCNVEVSDGKATEVKTNDANVKEFTHTVNVDKEKNAQEDIMIFRYSPEAAESVVLEITYDDQVDETYDEYNTVYFDKASDVH